MLLLGCGTFSDISTLSFLARSEGMTGIAYLKTERRFSTFIRDPKVKQSFDNVREGENELILEPAARLAVEGKLQTSRHSNSGDSKKTK